MLSLLKTGNRQVSRKWRKRSGAWSYIFWQEDKKCNCHSRLIRPFKLLRSREMIDVHIPHLHQKSGNRSCLAMLLQDEKIFLSDFTISLTFSPSSRPFLPLFYFVRSMLRSCLFILTNLSYHFHCNKCLIAHFDESL